MTYPNRSAILERVGEWAEPVDRAIASGVHQRVADLGEWSSYEWQASLQELLKLSQGEDANYDRPTIGPSYALWYHARRVNPLVSQLERIFRLVRDRGIAEFDIVDLGAGTGAVAWAAALVAAAVSEQDEPPHATVHEVESSPFMSETADCLWAALHEEIDSFGTVTREVVSHSWPNATLDRGNPTWLLASFLLDHTDKQREEEMAKALHRVVDNCQAEGVVFTVVSNKKKVAVSAIDSLEATHAWEGLTRRATPLWTGKMPHATEVRRELYRSFGVSSNLVKKAVEFSGDKPHVREARRPIGQQGTLVDERPWVHLTDEQQLAVDAPLDRHLFVAGAAGSGKSIVLIERLMRLIKRPRPGASRSILVTSFNKGMITQLDRWLTDRLANDGIANYTRTGGDADITYKDVGTGRDTVRFLNWDKAPTKLFGYKESAKSDSAWLKEAATVLEELRRSSEVSILDRMTPAFLLAEYRRVIYGLGAIRWEDYRTVVREGRGLPLQEPHRRAVWLAYEKLGPTNFTGRRVEMLRAGRSDKLDADFTDVFIDEVQDFAPADVESALAFWDRSGTVFYTGDEAQALFVGMSYRRPSHPTGRWGSASVVRLNGSHRLPVPIARAVGNLAEAAIAEREANNLSAEDVSVPSSRKAAVIGTRPIVVLGSTNELAVQIEDIRAAYSGFLDAEAGSRYITIAEPDPLLAKLLDDAVSTTVKKIKGLERGMVVWSGAGRLDHETERLETAYTVMTRTSCLLVLAIDSDRLLAPNLDVLSKLDGTDLLFWTEKAEAWWWDHFRPSTPPRPADDGGPAKPDKPKPVGAIGTPRKQPAPAHLVDTSWGEGAPCELHELGWCTLCKPRQLPRTVVMTKGSGAAFHARADCPALQSGQRLVASRGGDPAEVVKVALASAINNGNFPCMVCLPHAEGRL